jgi:ribosomal protection tetracycline resistance protein
MAALRQQTATLSAQPALFGSALTGVGTAELMHAIASLLPAADNDPNGPLSARVFKIERTADRARVAFVRVYSGTLAVRQHIGYGDGMHGRVLQMELYGPGGAGSSPTVSAGQIAAVQGLNGVRVGDFIGEERDASFERQFPPPTLESVVEAVNKRDQPRLRTALVELSEQDPLINVRQDEQTDDLSVSLYGEVQREVIEATLARDYGVTASFHDTTVIYIERPAGLAVEEQVISAPTHTNIAGKSSPDSSNPYNATLALRIEPLPPGSGVEVRLDVDVHLVPLYIYKTVEGFGAALTEHVTEALRRGLYGWEVTDCRVSIIDSGYSRTGSTARDFRLLTLMIVRTALERATTLVCEPMARLSLDVPPSSTPGVGSTLAQLGGRVLGQASTERRATIVAVIPNAKVGEIKWRLPGLTAGQGVMETDFAGYLPVVGHPPQRRVRRER